MNLRAKRRVKKIGERSASIRTKLINRTPKSGEAARRDTLRWRKKSSKPSICLIRFISSPLRVLI